jgi:hypothetical protein
VIRTLTGSDIAELSTALAGAFDLAGLEMATHASTGDRLFVEYVGPGQPLRPTIAALLNALDARGLTANLLAYAYRNRPHRSDLRKLIARLCPQATADGPVTGTELSAQLRGALQHNPPTTALAPGFERNVRPHLHQLDVRIWRERQMAIERRVCAVEIAGNPVGSGFLVGPKAVLTNWHVVEHASAPHQVSAISCRFDYVRLANGGIQKGVVVKLDAEGLVDSSRYSPAEAIGAHDPPPAPDELDYAVLRLAEPVGDYVVDGSTRGWITLPAAAPNIPPHSPLLIMQHPLSAPMKLALDTDAILSTNANGTRVRYATNTESGSSGSPCFTMDWELAALHHYGDPAWKLPNFNQGVPVAKVRELIMARGFAGVLGG